MIIDRFCFPKAEYRYLLQWFRRDHPSIFLSCGMRTYGVKGVAGVDGEDDENSLGVSVVAFGDGFELVLSSSVPDL